MHKVPSALKEYNHYSHACISLLASETLYILLTQPVMPFLPFPLGNSYVSYVIPPLQTSLLVCEFIELFVGHMLFEWVQE